jgi:protocatechuate 3,4-dioxygenase alpha subunit
MTGSQTVGPYFQLGMAWLYTREIGAAAKSGEHVQVSGRVFDGNGASIPDAVLEIWQADAHGRFATWSPSAPGDPAADGGDAEFHGFGRVPTDPEGQFTFRTVKPGRVPFGDGRSQAPHLSIQLFARGLLKPVCTRLYFPDEASNEEDPVLKLVPAARRATLIAQTAAPGLRWDIYLQGERETVFFQY